LREVREVPTAIFAAAAVRRTGITDLLRITPP
jgi:hypothetical protein